MLSVTYSASRATLASDGGENCVSAWLRNPTRVLIVRIQKPSLPVATKAYYVLGTCLATPIARALL